MVDRQAKLQEAMNAGDNVRVLTVTSKLVRSRPTHVRVDWVHVVSFTRSCDARYGMQGVRVGEARNPGPPSAAGSSMETTRSSAPTGFRRLRPCRDESGRNVAPV